MASCSSRARRCWAQTRISGNSLGNSRVPHNFNFRNCIDFAERENEECLGKMLILAFSGGKSYFAQEISRIFEGSRERNQQKELICPLVARNSGLGQATARRGQARATHSSIFSRTAFSCTRASAASPSALHRAQLEHACCPRSRRRRCMGRRRPPDAFACARPSPCRAAPRWAGGSQSPASAASAATPRSPLCRTPAWARPPAPSRRLQASPV